MKALILGLVVLGGVLAASAARADNYVCLVDRVPISSSMGPNGYVIVGLTSSPNCGGSVVGYWYYCSKGATDTNWCAIPSNCAGGTDYTYSELGLEHLAGRFQQAATTSQKVWVGNCGGSGNIWRGAAAEFDGT